MLTVFANAVRSRPGLWIGNAFACWLLGLGLEALQHIMYRTAFEWADCWDDGIGIAVVLMFSLALRIVGHKVTASKA